jgi:hypothetical protein
MDVAIPESTFVYTPPPGAAVMTVTPSTPQEEVRRFLAALGPGVK